MTPDDPPRQIASYTILDTLGEGGMGVVYLAEQHEPVRRVVALKVLKAEHASPGLLARFQAERQALAVMDHPGIAKVFDAGVGEDGRPWFAMERVEGSPLPAFCDARRMPVRERVRLFAEVCNAVQHAHQKGLIHRDLKPSNVLVTEVDGRPVPRIIDFGIARAVEVDGPHEERITRVDQVVGTPAYMSPEQIEGSPDIDTRSDIYALGVLLYELLVGTLPYPPSAYRGWMSVAAATLQEPPSPVRRLATLEGDPEAVAALRSTTLPRLRGELRGDLEVIVARAMERDRDLRYETANGVALELQRYLRDEPVRAREGNRAYVARKFVRRHRGAVAFAATVAVGLVAFTASTVVQSRRVARARDVADARRGQAEALIDFMLVDLREKLEPLGRLDVLDGVGDQALAYFASLPEGEFSDAELLSRSQALYQIGSVRLDEGRSDEAMEAFQESERLAAALSRRNPGDADLLFGLSQSHFYVGYAAWLRADYAGAEAAFNDYLDAANRLVALDPASLEYRMEVGFAQNNLGSVREARGDLDGAEAAFLQGLAVAEELARRDSTNVDALGELAESHNHLAVVYRRQGRYDDALAEHQRELALKQEVLRLAPDHAYWRTRLAMTHHFLGVLEITAGRTDAGLADLDAAAAMVAEFLARDPANTTWDRQLAMTLMKRGELRAVLGRNAAALADLDAAVTRMEALVDTDATGFDWRMDLARTLEIRAQAHLRGGRPDAALRDLEAFHAAVDAEDPSRRRVREVTAQALLTRGRVLAAMGDSQAARTALEASLDLLEVLVDEVGGIELRPVLAHAYLALDRSGEARRELEALMAAGYRERSLLEAAEARGIVP